jgi:hypothetical protein
MRVAALYRRARHLPVVLLFGAASACAEGPTTPAALAGRYPLQRVAGSPLPAPIYDAVVPDTSGNFHLRLDATTGWLELTADGHYDHGVDLAVTIDGTPQPTTRWRDHGRYTVQGDTLAFDSDYIQDVSFRGVAGAGRVQVDQNLAEPIAGAGAAVRFTFGE